MEFINGWVTSIVLLILLAVVLELLLPNTALKNYVKLVVSLMLLVMMLQPVLSLFHQDPEKWLYSLVEQASQQEQAIDIEEKINSQKKEIDQFFDAYTSEQVAVQLKDQVEEKLASRHRMSITHIAVVETAEEPGVTIEVHVGSEKAESSLGAGKPIEPVSIEIDTTDGRSQQKLVENNDEVALFLADEWGVPESAITLVREGGVGE
ncbi:stage III sporulation protein AF [Shouchella clausii]|uniref:Stage III sporulation protein AF n=1 Tax=Shouchella clausii TaxID=79880 RepID=A0A268RYZ8_SHOCL|nr:stage III sporulation protein AF [Shouchella clausii]PAE96026.1 stage III sporulation protein AF [Shouchella clausii]PAF25462.1 stage III sporulation protein AF [Shouchella clausii]